MRLQILSLVLAIAAASCAQQQSKPAAQPQPPAVQPKPPTAQGAPATPPPMQTPPAELALPKGAWTDWPLAGGNWVYRTDGRGSVALFGEPGKDALVLLRCDKQAGQVYFSRSGAAGSSQLVIRTSSTSRTLQAASTGGNPPYLAVALAPSDPIFDALAFSRGRFALEASGMQALAIPAWAEIGRVIEDCRV